MGRSSAGVGRAGRIGLHVRSGQAVLAARSRPGARRERLRHLRPQDQATKNIRGRWNTQFSQAGVKPNLLRSCDTSLRSVSSGIRCRGVFCDAAQGRHFPPNGGSFVGSAKLLRNRVNICVPRSSFKKSAPAPGFRYHMEDHGSQDRRGRPCDGGRRSLQPGARRLETAAGRDYFNKGAG